MAKNSLNFRYDLRHLNISNAKTLTVLGNSSNIPVTESVLWSENNGYTFPTVAQSITISSSSANDALAGTGANYVYVEYLDSNWAEQTATLTMNGTSAVAFPTTAIRVNSARVVFSGSNGSNVGNIFVGYGALTSGKPATVLCKIDASEGISQQAVYSVPANCEAALDSALMGTASAKLVTINFNLYLFGLNTKMVVGKYYLYQNTINLGPDLVSRSIPAKSDITFTGIASSGTAEVALSAAFIISKSTEINRQQT